MKEPYHELSLFFFIVLLTFCPHTSIAQDSIRPQIDSLEEYYVMSKANIGDLEKALPAIDHYIDGSLHFRLDSLTYKGYMLKTRILGFHKQYTAAIHTSNILLNLAIDKKDSAYSAKAYYKLGIYNDNLDRPLAAFENYNESFKIHRDLKDSLLASKRLLAMANTQVLLGDYIGSNITAIAGLEYLTTTPDIIILLGLFQNITISYREQENYEQALFWNNKAIRFATQPSLFKKIGSRNHLKFQNTKANILADQQEYEKAISILEGLLPSALELPDSLEYARVLSNLGKIRWLKNNQDETIEPLLLDALAIRQKANSRAGLVSSNIHLARYFADKNKGRAILFARDAYKYSKLLNNQIAVLESLDMLTKLDSTRISYYKEFKEISMSLQEKRKRARQIYEPTRFENERLTIEKEKSIAQIEKEKSQKKWLLIFFAMSLVGILIYLRLKEKMQKEREKLQKEKNTSEKILEIYQAENRLSKKVHDVIANNIYLVKLLIDREIGKREILKKLDLIYAKARDISRENTEIGDEDFDKELENMILSYDSQDTRVFIVGLKTISWENTLDVVKVTIYKVIQELMTNMDKHSKSSIASVVFSKTNNHSEIIYTDNGIGFDYDNCPEKNGISIMENRIKKIGGSISFDSKRKSGIKIFIKISDSI